MFIRELKIYIRRLLLITVFSVFSLLLLFHFTRRANEQSAFQCPPSQSQVLGKTSLGLPARLIIPAIKVNAKIQPMGITQKGEMEVPDNAVDVGWFKLGPRPGERGSAVMAGHFDGENGETGVFADLYQLKAGDKLYIENDRGTSLVFVVRENRLYDPGYADEVFSQNDGVHLNLITCDGVWDGAKKSYSKRLVIFTDAAD